MDSRLDISDNRLLITSLLGFSIVDHLIVPDLSLDPDSVPSPESGLVPPDSGRDQPPTADPPHDLTALTPASPAHNSA